MASCSRLDVDELKPRAISFTVAKHWLPSTRAESDYADTYSDVPFGAYAWYKGANSTNDATFMTNQKVAFDGLYWATEGTTYYWPNGGALDFICYSPYSETEGPSVTETSITWSDWNILTHHDTDLLYATKATGLTGPVKTAYYSGVPTIFHHALAQVAFNVRLAYDEVTAPTGDKTRWKVTLHDLTLYNMATEGSLVLTLDSDDNWTSDDTWTASKWVNVGFRPEEPLTAGQSLAVVEPMMVLPQRVDMGVTMGLDVSIITERDAGDGYKPFLEENNVHLEAPLYTSQLTVWGMNQRIVYNIILTPSRATEPGGGGGGGADDVVPQEITFDPAVHDWDNITLEMNINI